MRQYPEALTLQSTDGFWIDRLGVGSLWIQGFNFIPSTLLWTGAVLYEGSGPPLTNQLLGGFSMPVKASFPDNNTDALAIGWGLHVQAGNLPTSTFVMTIALNDVLVATLTVNTDGTYSYSSSSGLTWTANVRDRITILAPSVTDATMNKFFFTIVGTLIQ
jgi:hypothetical protein